MDTDVEHRLERALAVVPSEKVRRSLLDAVAESEQKAGTGAFHRFGRKGVAAVALSMALVGGAAATAAAAPDFLAMLFPPAVSNTYTFESGVKCTVDTKIVPDFVTSKEPEVAVQAAQEFLSRLDVSELPIQAKYREVIAQRASLDAARQATQLADPANVSPQLASKFAAESEAVQTTVTAAIFAELDRAGLDGGVAIESAEVTCS
jgi:hypothetical protein